MYSLSKLRESFSSTLAPTVVTLGDKFNALYAELEAGLISSQAYSILEDADKHSGVYALFYKDELVYLGSAQDVRTRLRQHRKTVSMATLIDENDVTYRFVRCDYCATLSTEKKLIQHYQPAWNSTGFGRRPGRDSRHQRPSVWDEQYGARSRTLNPDLPERVDPQ